MPAPSSSQRPLLPLATPRAPHLRPTVYLAALALFVATQVSAPTHAQTCEPPSPASVTDAAVRSAGLGDVSGETYRRRIRASALLPDSARVELRAADDDVFRIESRLDQDFDEFDDADGSDLTDVQRTGVDRLREVRVVVSWRLSDLAWSSEHLAVERLRRDLRAERAELIEDTLDAYFDWLRVCVADDPTPESAWELAERHARLDALTRGWFSAALEANEACTTLCSRAP